MISIIIPVYNLENYIERTLDSVFAQTYRDIEVVAVDDGSKDNSPAILDAYAKKEPRLKVIHKPNGGVTMARLDGVKVASGDYIGFVDGDDLIDPDMYQRLYDNMMKYDADISHCGYRVIKTTGTEYKYNTGRVVRQDNQAGLIDLLEGSFVEPGLWNKLYNKTLLHSLFHEEAFDTSIIINEDLLMNYFLFREAKSSIYEDFCPYQYIKREGSASNCNAKLRDFEQPIHVRQIIMDDCNGKKEEIFGKKIYISKLINYYGRQELKSSQFSDFKKNLRKLIITNKNLLSYLSKKQKIAGYMIIHCPIIYEMLNDVRKEVF